MVPIRLPRRFQRILKPARRKVKKFLYRHHALHMFFHQTYCRFVGTYSSFSWDEWLLANILEARKSGKEMEE